LVATLAVPLPTVNPLTVMSVAKVLPPDAAAQAKADPVQLKYVLAVVGASINAVAPAPDWYKTLLATPPATFVAEPAEILDWLSQVGAAAPLVCKS
jgi:hypothetical protein